MSETRCEICKTSVASGGMRAHERSAGHQRTAPLAAEAIHATEQAIADGLARLTDHDFHSEQGTPFLNSIGVRTANLLSGYGRGRNHSWKYPEWWAEAWAVSIADWRGVDVETRKRALARVAADPSLRRYVPDCPLVLEFQGVTVTLSHNGYKNDLLLSHEGYESDLARLSNERVMSMSELPLATISLPGHGRAENNMWHARFDDTGTIRNLAPFRAHHLSIDTPDEAPPLHVMIDAQTAIEHFARCNSAIRWLANNA